MVILIGMLTAIALWRAGRLRGLYASVICLAGTITLTLAEVKAAVLLMPVALALYFRRDIARYPWVSLLAGLGVLTLVLLILTGYSYIHYAPDKAGTSAEEKILSALDPNKEVESADQLGRVTHLVFWWKENVHASDVQHTLLGYGMGATQETRFGFGEVQRKYPYDMGVTSTTILLWETGLLGHILFVLVLLGAAKVSASQSRSSLIPDVHRILLNVGAVGLVLIAITLPYKAMALRSVQIQLLLMLLLGQAAYWAASAGVQDPPTAATARKEPNV